MKEFGDEIRVIAMKTMEEYPPGLIGVVSALFGQSIAASHGVDWTLDAMIAEQQCEFFRRFDPGRDRVWMALQRGRPRGALTIDGPRSEAGRESARLRFFILDPELHGRGIGHYMVDEAMRFCREQGFRRVYLTTLPGLDAALRLYRAHGFTLVQESTENFHGSAWPEQTLEWSAEATAL
jgi:GNAT superfamily N-acetyltransferase